MPSKLPHTWVMTLVHAALAFRVFDWLWTKAAWTAASRSGLSVTAATGAQAAPRFQADLDRFAVGPFRTDGGGSVCHSSRALVSLHPHIHPPHHRVPLPHHQ